MTERYWEASEASDAMLDWASENVANAIKYFWEEAHPVGWIEDDLAEHGGRLVLTIGGPEKPKVGGPENPDEPTDVYSISFDLLSELTDWSAPYAYNGGPRSEAQAEDMRERAAALRKFAREIERLADSAELVANKD